MKVLTVLGARTQFIKSAPVSRALERAGIQEIIVHTGQHYDQNMSAVFFQELEISEQDINLGVGSGPHGQQTGRMLMALKNVLQEKTLDWLIVYGVTNSTHAGSLAAAKLNIPIAHVEAGLRSYNNKIPEEINRLFTDHLSTLLLCPTQTAMENFRAEGIGDTKSSGSKPTDWSTHLRATAPAKMATDLTNHHPKPGIVLVGDVMYDSVLHNTRLAIDRSEILSRLKVAPQIYAMATVHRSENTDDQQRLTNIFSALEIISSDGLPVVVPLHPRTRKYLNQAGFIQRSVQIIDPVSYLDMLMLEKSAKLIFTDSGGVQKEAYWMKVPCITLRDETEWIETVKDGWNILTGADKGKIIESTKKTYWPTSQNQSFGDGKSADKIVSALIAADGCKHA